MKQITCPHCGDTYPDFDVAHVCSKGPYALRLKPKMNERIRELAEQASHQSHDGYPVTIPYSNDFAKKFAELIVRECAKLCIDEIADPRDTVEQKCAVKIMKHFEINNDRS